MQNVPFVNMFFPSATGLSICGNDLVLTIVRKKLITYLPFTFRVKDFLLKEDFQLSHALIQQRIPVGETILSLPRSRCIIREIECPHANLKEFRDALEYQLDSFIPFTNEDVYYDIHSLSHIGRKTNVLIVAVKKIELDSILSKLKLMEITPSRVIISSFAFLPILGENNESVAVITKNPNNYCYNIFEHGHLVCTSVVKKREGLVTHLETNAPSVIYLEGVEGNFLSAEYKEKVRVLDEGAESYGAALYGLSSYHCGLSLIKSRNRRLNPQMTLLCFLAGILIFFVFLIPYIQKCNDLSLLQTVKTRINSVKRNVVVVDRIKERMSILEETVRNVNELREKHVPRIDAISELAKKLPDNAWTKAINLTHNTFEIEGIAESSANLIPILENSPLFSGVGLSSPVTKTRNDEESFRIKGNLVKQ
ncbi:MAG: PilN domain-containing protein [Candidatus Brocadiaceae bacterium]|nr:PilN domain-containing protein [Candidatus Brocadiaceae bacterium]